MLVLGSNLKPADDLSGNYKTFVGDAIDGRNRAVDFFHTFWRTHNEGDRKPSRADVKPAILKQFLNRVVLMDIVPKTDGEFDLLVKLIGTHVTAFYGELSGMRINDMPNKAAAERIYGTCKMVLGWNEPVLSVTTGISQDKVHLEAYALYMPLYNSAGQIDKIMASVDVKSLLK